MTMKKADQRPSVRAFDFPAAVVPAEFETWRDDAACKGLADQDGLFFPNAQTGETPAYGPALNVCRTCPVRLPCLDYALREKMLEDGVWGGYTPKQRKAVRRSFFNTRQEFWMELEPVLKDVSFLLADKEFHTGRMTNNELFSLSA